MSEQAETKRDRVRRVLISPLLRAGMRKQTRMSVEDYQAMLVRLADKLGFMSEENLRGLVPVLTRNAKGREHNQWPDEVAIVKWAYSVQVPPPRECDYVVSVIRSHAGQLARERGYLPELLMEARKLGPPFSKVNIDRLERLGRDSRRERDRLRRRLDIGETIRQERQDWLDWYDRHEREALSIMADVHGASEAT